MCTRCTGSNACVYGICCLPATADLQAAIDAAKNSGTTRLCWFWTLINSIVHDAASSATV